MGPSADDSNAARTTLIESVDCGRGGHIRGTAANDALSFGAAMQNPRFADAFFEVVRQQHTGVVVLESRGRRARLSFRDGDLVGIESPGAGISAVGALLKHRLLDLPAVDALWARGEATLVGDACLAELKLSRRQVVAAHSLELLIETVSSADALKVEPLPAEPGETLIESSTWLRRVFEMTPFAEPAVFRRTTQEVPAVLTTDEELAVFVELNDFAQVSVGLRPVFELLARRGEVESLSLKVWEAREADRIAREEEEAARVAAEQEAERQRLAREEEEAARVAAEQEAERQRIAREE